MDEVQIEAVEGVDSKLKGSLATNWVIRFSWEGVQAILFPGSDGWLLICESTPPPTHHTHPQLEMKTNDIVRHSVGALCIHQRDVLLSIQSFSGHITSVDANLKVLLSSSSSSFARELVNAKGTIPLSTVLRAHKILPFVCPTLGCVALVREEKF